MGQIITAFTQLDSSVALYEFGLYSICFLKRLPLFYFFIYIVTTVYSVFAI